MNKNKQYLELQDKISNFIKDGNWLEAILQAKNFEICNKKKKKEK